MASLVLPPDPHGGFGTCSDEFVGQEGAVHSPPVALLT